MVVILATLSFEGLVFGGELAEQSFPKFEQPNEGDCSGFLDGVACFFGWIVEVAKLIFGTVVFLFNLVTFNVPGTPLFIKVVLSGGIIGSIVWCVATLIRGN